MATLLKSLSATEAAAGTAAQELQRWIEVSQSKSLLRFITCGSVDDGKSTLIGRLLYDSRQLFEDQLASLANDSRRHGTQGEELDLALLVDGLSAEREQGITIDVAYRFFATERRKFIVADTPGHEQYTRNMVTGASTADLAVILVDATRGILTQTRRHSFLGHLIGIRHFVLAVNKMDLVGYDEKVFDEIVEDYAAFAGQAGIAEFIAIPLSGLKGDNVTERSAALPWYCGPTLLQHLEFVGTGDVDAADQQFQMAIQVVSRPDYSFRGFAGRIAGGRLKVGDAVVILPAGRRSTISRIVTFDGDLREAVAGQSVTLTLADEIDCSRGDVIVAAHAVPETVQRVEASLVWMSDSKLVPHRSYWLKIGTKTVSARIDAIRSLTNVNSLVEEDGEPLDLNDIGHVVIDLDQPVAAIRYAQNRKLGGFILIDKITRSTVAAGMIEGFAAGSSTLAKEPECAIRWITGPNRCAWAQSEADRLRAQGQNVVILDRAAIEAFGAPDVIRTARQAARLLVQSGAQVLVTLGVAPEDARPGERIDPAIRDGGGGEWVI